MVLVIVFSVIDSVGNLVDSDLKTSSELHCSIEEMKDLEEKAEAHDDDGVESSDKKKENPSVTTRFALSFYHRTLSLQCAMIEIDVLSTSAVSE